MRSFTARPRDLTRALPHPRPFRAFRSPQMKRKAAVAAASAISAMNLVGDGDGDESDVGDKQVRGR